MEPLWKKQHAAIEGKLDKAQRGTYRRGFRGSASKYHSTTYEETLTSEKSQRSADMPAHAECSKVGF